MTYLNDIGQRLKGQGQQAKGQWQQDQGGVLRGAWEKLKGRVNEFLADIKLNSRR